MYYNLYTSILSNIEDAFQKLYTKMGLEKENSRDRDRCRRVVGEAEN